MKKITLLCTLFLYAFYSQAQGPAVTSWLQNTTETGSYYVAGNSTVIENNILVNCQKIEYSDDFVYVHTKGVPAYPTGPFQDGNPSQASDQNAIFKMPLNPTENTGTSISTNPGNIGIFINGVALFDYRDGVAWNPQTNNICGGPGNAPCPGGPGATQAWNRDAIPAERPGFDCAKGHPAMGNYHHHQNPSAYKLDLEVISDVCNLYDAEGLYVVNENEHSPLIGFAYDGFPIYGTYGYKNTDGTGGITRIKSSYELTTNTTRVNGPNMDLVVGSQTFFNGYFKEDYVYVDHSGEPDYLDEHNGRFAVTPEYPNGTYAYYATVDEGWNSTYPYVVGPTFYGNASNRKVTAVNEPTTVYTGVSALTEAEFKQLDVTIFPNPAADLLVVQINTLVKEDMVVELLDLNGKVLQRKSIIKGSTIAYFDVQTVYDGVYFLQLSSGENRTTEKVFIAR
jgi:YHYH protein/Secretion system C-terminal sorting domain